MVCCIWFHYFGMRESSCNDGEWVFRGQAKPHKHKSTSSFSSGIWNTKRARCNVQSQWTRDAWSLHEGLGSTKSWKERHCEQLMRPTTPLNLKVCGSGLVSQIPLQTQHSSFPSLPCAPRGWWTWSASFSPGLPGEFKRQKTLEGGRRWGERVFLSWNNLLYLVAAGFGEGRKGTENRKLDASFHFPFANAYKVDCPIFLPSHQILVKLPFFWCASSLVLFNPVDYPCSNNPYLRWHVFTLTHIIVISAAWRN